MEEVVVVGLDIAKSVFQLHGVSAAGAVVLQRKVTRSRLLPLFGKLRRRWSGSRPAPRRTTGRGSSSSSATMCA